MTAFSDADTTTNRGGEGIEAPAQGAKVEAMMESNESLSAKVIGAAIRVHKELGPGFLESFYEEALCIELELLGLRFERQLLVPVYYRERILGEHRLDLLVESELVVELKAVQGFESIHF